MKWFLVSEIVLIIVIAIAICWGLWAYIQEEPEPIGIQFGDEVCITGIGMVRGMPYPDTMIICGELKPEPINRVEDETGL